jgi:hypothetical protein
MHETVRVGAHHCYACRIWKDKRQRAHGCGAVAPNRTQGWSPNCHAARVTQQEGGRGREVQQRSGGADLTGENRKNSLGSG